MKWKSPERMNGLADSMIRTMTIKAHQCNAINMGQGFPEFEPHPSIITAAKESISLARNNQYSEDRGAPILREAISEKYNRFYGWKPNPEEEITVVCGVTEAIVVAMLAVVEAGNKVAIIEPAHENYLAATLFAGAKPVWILLEPPDFPLDLRRVEDAFKSGVKFIVVNSPHNPTGRVFSKQEMEGLARLCVKYDVVAITDEIYEHIVYDDHIHTPLALQPGMPERTITTSGIGKTYNLTGWRIGYIIAHPILMRVIRRTHTYVSICAPTPLQHAAVTALNLPDSYYEDLKSRYSISRKRMMEILGKTGFAAQSPEGAYYVMADFSNLTKDDDVTFCHKLAEKARVAVIPGSSFYSRPGFGHNLVRFAFPKPVSVLDEVESLLGRFAD